MSGGDKPPVICWDSCIFLAWFNQEEDKPLGEIERILRSIVHKKTTLIVSTISYAEVLDQAGKSDAGTQFKGFVRRPNVVMADVDPRVGSLAADIRINVLEALREGRVAQGVKIPDALIAATAVVYRAAELHTFDPVLLAISKWPVINGLPIIRPDDAGRTALGF